MHKSVRRKATKRKAQKKRVAKGENYSFMVDHPRSQEPTEQELKEQFGP